MDVAYHPAARAEFRRAVHRYERDRQGLGHAFLAAIREAEELIGEHPDAGTPLRSNRRFVVQRFPYAIIYRRESKRLFILAVAHLRRHPEYWHARH